ncbi:MAG: FtsX-like permease family protein [Treponema sp.]|nr:FtsX-like permease family protein [Treponema sp.]
MFYFCYAFRSLFERYRQYRSLFIVCTVAIGIIFSVLLLTDGMIDALRGKAKQYYGGDVQFLGGLPDHKEITDDVYFKVKSVVPAHIKLFRRFDYNEDTTFYFEGVSVSIRMMKGVEFSAEKDLFKQVTLAEGKIPETTDVGALLISQPVARKLGVHIGDSITVFTKTKDQYNNTGELIVYGIFKDSSMFGMYTAYMNASDLSTLSGYKQGHFDKIGFFKPHGTFSVPELRYLYSSLSKQFDMVPLYTLKWELDDNIDDHKYDKAMYGLIPLESNNEELSMLISAMQLVVMMVILPLLLIVAFGIGSSYRVIVLKRTVETGTLRAIGMRPSGIIRVFVVESFLLLMAGFVAGLVLNACILAVVSRFNLSFIPAFDIFLQGGHLMPCFNIGKNIVMVVTILVTTLGSVLFTVRNLIHTPPVYALNTTV